MEKINRSPAPDILQENYKKWGKEWEIKYKKTGSKGFRWRTKNKINSEKECIEKFKGMTQFHCSYCDIQPVRKGQIQPTIDHFRPKSKFPLLAYVWHNLFLSCESCQNYKQTKFDRSLLKPDRLDYNFDKYFFIDFETGKIMPLPNSKNPEKEESAKITIDIFGLNRDARPEGRKKELEKYEKSNDSILNDYSYRFFIERSLV